jgi:hypothetical protein
MSRERYADPIFNERHFMTAPAIITKNEFEQATVLRRKAELAKVEEDFETMFELLDRIETLEGNESAKN